MNVRKRNGEKGENNEISVLERYDRMEGRIMNSVLTKIMAVESEMITLTAEAKGISERLDVLRRIITETRRQVLMDMVRKDEE